MSTRTHRQTSAAAAAAAAASPRQPLTPDMRDRQARGKDPYADADDDVDDEEDQEGDDFLRNRLRAGSGGLPRESFEEREKKEFAMSVLDNPEMLLMHAQAQGDSVAGQRLRFLRMLCPVEDEKDRDLRRKQAQGGSSTVSTVSPRDRRQW